MSAALAQAWPPFVLVAGLLLIGLIAGRDGLFDLAASHLVRLPGPPVVLLLACFGLVALVTALLNLDTSVVFLTPVLIETARRRGVDVGAFLYGSVFMANASSLFLPGSNLTNLLVLSGRRTTGAAFFAQMLPVALVVPAVTAAGLVLLHRRGLFAGHGEHRREQPEALQLGLGFWGALLAAALIVILRNAALPVLAVGLILMAVRAVQRRLVVGEMLVWLGLPTLVGLFALAVALGTLARASAFPADLLHHASAPLTTLVGALASVLVNNLPAAVLLTSSRQLHTGPLLLGLNVGPNLAVTGSLAALLWWRAARAGGIKPSVLSYSRQGLLLAPLALLAGILVNGG